MSNKKTFLLLAFFLVGVVILFLVPRKNLQLNDETSNVIPRGAKIEIPKDKETCLAKNGKWAKIGPAPVESCNLPTSDGGKECTDTSECEGTCLAALSNKEQNLVMREKKTIQTKGKCTPWVITVGCQARVQNGKVQGILCID